MADTALNTPSRVVDSIALVHVGYHWIARRAKQFFIHESHPTRPSELSRHSICPSNVPSEWPLPAFFFRCNFSRSSALSASSCTPERAFSSGRRFRPEPCLPWASNFQGLVFLDVVWLSAGPFATWSLPFRHHHFHGGFSFRPFPAALLAAPVSHRASRTWLRPRRTRSRLCPAALSLHLFFPFPIFVTLSDAGFCHAPREALSRGIGQTPIAEPHPRCLVAASLGSGSLLHRAGCGRVRKKDAALRN
jgi:hypothetical protein